MNLSGEQNAFLLDVAKLIEFIQNKDGGVLVTGGELYRTPEQEEIYVKTGKSKTMNSNHLRRLAIDLNFIFNGKLVSDTESLRPYGEYWESLSPENRAGMFFKSFPDTDHFERNVA
jgi:hypothetical protein